MGFSYQFVAYYTIIRKEAARLLRVWAAALLPPAITTTLYFVIFGHIIGSRIGNMSGYSYVDYIAPGLIMMAVITSSYACSVSAFFHSKFIRDIDELLITPMRDWVMILGFISAGIMRGLLVGCIVTVIALFFTHLSAHSLIVVIGVAILTAFIFATAGVINAIFASTFDEISLVPTFILTPLTYLGGVFYSINLLPPVWREISKLNPIVYIVTSFRYGILGVGQSMMLFSVLVMCLVAILLFFISLWLIRRGNRVRH